MKEKPYKPEQIINNLQVFVESLKGKRIPRNEKLRMIRVMENMIERGIK